MQNLITANNVDAGDNSRRREYLLEDCVDILDNQRIPINSDDRAKRQGDVPYYGATGQVGYINDFIFNEELVLLGEDGAPFLDKSKPIAYIINGKSWVNNHAHVIRAKSGLANNWFIKYYLDYFNFTDFVGGTTRLKLNQSAMRNIPIRLPSLQEQEKIASTLKKVAILIEQNKLKITKAKNIINQFKDAILSAAVTGKLTNEWRERNPNKSTNLRYQSRVDKDYNLSDIPNNWQLINLGEIVDVTSSKRIYASEYVKSGIPFYRSKEIGELSKYGKTEDNLFIRNEKYNEIKKRFGVPQKGDILLTSVGTIGKAWIVDERVFYYKDGNVTQLRVSNYISNNFLLNYINSPIFNKAVMSVIAGSAYNALTIEKIKVLPLPLPPIDEQLEINKKVVALFNIAKLAEVQISKAEVRVSKLTQAILTKTFRNN